jgi:hypothetical protein
MAKMREVDLSGLSPAEAEAKAREAIDMAQEDALAGYEVMLVDYGGDLDDVAAELVRYRGQWAAWREQALDDLRGWLVRDYKSLH